MESNEKVNPRIQLLTDDIISIYSGENVLTTYKDYNGKLKDYERMIPGGPLDGKIFGSIWSNQCNCGHIRISSDPNDPNNHSGWCSTCESELLDEAVSSRRYARIDLPVSYLNDLRYEEFNKFLRSKFQFKFIGSNQFNSYFGYDTKIQKFVFDYAQFGYEDGVITVSDQITDINKCSYEGLLHIIIEYFPNLISIYKQFINSSILVIPMPFRAPKFVYEPAGRTLKNHEITTAYKCIMYAITEYYEDKALPKLNNVCDLALLNANLRQFVSKIMMHISALNKSSKQNLARILQSHRLNNSGRCTIVPAPDLNIDEVYIPRSLMYETCRDEFIQYISDKLGVTQKKAEVMYVQQATTKEVQDLFNEYIEKGNDGLGKYVLINRNPTLYELGMSANKVKLTNDYTIGLPPLICGPFGADFDGDSMSFYLIPDRFTNLVTYKMSPRNQVYYKKNQKPLYTPSHEMMAGLLISTKVIVPKNEIESFIDITEAEQRKKTDKNFKWQTQCIIDSKVTTLGRAKLGEMFGVDIDEFIKYHNEKAIEAGRPGVDGLTSDLVIILFENLAKFNDRPERIHSIQEFALKISTLSGATAPKLSQLHVNLDQEFLKKIKDIEESEKLSDKEKDIKIRETFDEFIDKSLWERDEHGNKIIAKDENGNERISGELRRQVSESSRAKESQLLAMCVNQLNVGIDKVAHVTEGTLIEGLPIRDYVPHAIENRVVQDIKQQSTPNSGYNTRQLTFLGAQYFYTELPDEKNPGIFIPLSQASGRTRTDGSVITLEEERNARKDEYVKVRSIVTTTLRDRYAVSKDCISKFFNWREHDNAGISLLTAMTENLTQAGLSLKHGGRLFEVDKNSKFIAPEDGNLQLLEYFIVFNGNSGKSYYYPRCVNFISNYSESGTYKKGEAIGYAYKLFTPSFKLDSIIRLLGAKPASSKKSILNNKITMNECYAYADGVIKYETSNDRIVSVRIGSFKYEYDETACYFLPEGTKVKKGQRFCSGLLNIDKAIHKLNDIVEVFYLFRSQFNELIPGMRSELIEMVYSIIVRKVNNQIKHTQIGSTVKEIGSFYLNLAFMDSKSTLRKVGHKGTEFMIDPFSEVLFPTFFLPYL